MLAAITGHVRAHELPGVEVRCAPTRARVPAYTIAADHPAIRAATAALEAVYPGQEVLLAVIAGTLPATALFEEVLGAKTLFFSFSTADEKLHAPNEFMRIPGCARACAPGSSCGGCWPTARTGWRRSRRGGAASMTDEPTRPTTTSSRGVDLPVFALAPEFGRVPPYDGGLRRAEHAARAERLLADNVVISLHDHPVRFPADMRDTPEYNRTGRQHTAFAGLRRLRA